MKIVAKNSCKKYKLRYFKIYCSKKNFCTYRKSKSTKSNPNITVNKNSVPNDPQSPFVTSGIRLGTAAITTRGFKETETAILGNLICDVLDDIEDESKIMSVKEKILNLTSQFPVYSKNKKAVA